jgi:phosphonate ABC transporter permease subunit PhnE
MNAGTPSSSSTALRRLLILISVAVGLAVFAYGWSVTEINFDKPQEPLRQQNFGNAIRELLSPDLFERDYEIKVGSSPFLVECKAGEAAPTAASAPTDGSPYLVVTPTCADSSTPITIQGFNFYPNSLARLTWVANDGTRSTQQIVGNTKDNFVTDDNGTFNVQIVVPKIRGSAGKISTIETQGYFPTGSPHFTDTAGLVLQKMVETIFLALIATAISILPSAVISIFAAHNLMRPVRISLGNLLVMVALLPVGWWIGTNLLAQLGHLILRAAHGGALAAGGTATLVIFGAVTSSRSLEFNPFNGRMRSIFNTLMVVLAGVIIVGILGVFGIIIGRWFSSGILGYISRFIGSLGQLIELLMVPICGLIGAFGLASIGGALTTDGLKKLDTTMQHVVGGVLGAICGAILLGMMALIGMRAAWLGFLTPIVAGVLGAQVLPLLYMCLTGKRQTSFAGRGVDAILWWVGFIAAFAVTFLTLNMGLAIIEGTLPPATSVTTLGFITISNYILDAMIIGLVLGGAGSFLVGTKANFSLGEVLYQTTRTILNTLRAIEPLIIALIFSIWVGIGPFAGVLALTLHSIASLAKLYSEQIESIDTGPIEALQSTGANRLQTIMYAVVPQVIPPFVSFTMYRWDINVRMSTIIGFVGGGGIGFVLQQQINLAQYRGAGVAVLAIAIVVSILDYLSATIRERYV